jgi:exosortase H (IPTLxxWG-CTERM-specific)
VIRFIVIFIALILLLFGAELTRPAQTYFVLPWTSALTSVASFILQSVDSTVISSGKVLANGKTGFSVSVEAGCNGIEAVIVLLAAMLAFPAPWRHKIAGILVGALTIQVLNLIRVITLFYIGQWNATAFQWMHLYVWQILIMLDVVVVWLVWIRMLSRHKASPDDLVPDAPSLPLPASTEATTGDVADKRAAP